jgi:FolB domain-containing protein
MRPNPKIPNWLGEEAPAAVAPSKTAPARPTAPAPKAESAPAPAPAKPAKSSDTGRTHLIPHRRTDAAAMAAITADPAFSKHDRIFLNEVEVHYHVGVTDEERSKPQRLLVSVEMTTDFSAAATTDFLATTIDYQTAYDRLLHFGEGRTWKLIEKLASDIATAFLKALGPQQITVEVKKFALERCRYTSVRVTRNRGEAA